MSDQTERLRKLGNFLMAVCGNPNITEAADRIEMLERVVRNLIDYAMPDNWEDDDLEPKHSAAWASAIIALGEDPADYSADMESTFENPESTP